jgi:hypothetical protein
MSDCHPDVGRIWRSRNAEPASQEFDKLPPWMQEEPKEPEDIDAAIDLPKMFLSILETLSPKEKKIVLLRYWFDMTFDGCGDLFELTGARIGQIEARAMRKMRHPTRCAMMGQYERKAYVRKEEALREAERLKDEEDYLWSLRLEKIVERVKKRQEDALIQKMFNLRENT